MRAARLHAVGEDLRIDEVPKPIADTAEAVIRVEAVSICGSDLHIVDGENLLPEFPRTLGHEIAGVIDELNDNDDTGFRVGDRVCIDFLVTCGSCRFCRIGRESLCVNRAGLGVQRDGGFAEYVAVPIRNLIRIPDGVSFEFAAVAADALATPCHAISKRAQVRPGTGAVVIGLGGLGLNAVRLLKVFGASPIVGLDLDPASRQRALAAGADFVFDGGSAEFAEWLAPQRDRLRCVFDFVGIRATVALGTEVVARGGRVVVVGLGAQPLELPVASAVVREELEVVGSYAFERGEIAELMDLLSQGVIDLSDSITHRGSLEDVNEGIRRLRTRDGAPSRIVLSPHR